MRNLSVLVITLSILIYRKDNTMRKEFIEGTSLKRAKKRAPWATVITKCYGGYMAFESMNEYLTWRGQI